MELKELILRVWLKNVEWSDKHGENIMRYANFCRSFKEILRETGELDNAIVALQCNNRSVDELGIVEKISLESEIIAQQKTIGQLVGIIDTLVKRNA
jgi:hypothetical protein